MHCNVYLSPNKQSNINNPALLMYFFYISMGKICFKKNNNCMIFKVINFFVFNFFILLRSEYRTLYMVGKCFTNYLHILPQKYLSQEYDCLRR